MYKFFRFEFLFNLKKPFTYVFFFMMIIQGVWYAVGTNDYHGNSNTLLNSSMGFYQNMSIMGVLLIIISSVVSAGALSRDIESKTAETLYSGILNDRKYFIGKYFAVLCLNMIVITGYPLGMMLLPYIGVGSPAQFGPVPWGQILHAMVIFTIPNIIFLVTCSVFLVVYSRKTGVAYVGSFLVMMMVMLTEANRGHTAYPFLLHLIDPFGYTIVMDILDGMSIAQRNTAYLEITDVLVVNRIVWLSISAVMFILSYARFDFKYFISRTSKKKSAEKKEVGVTKRAPFNTSDCKPEYGLLSMMSKSMRLSVIEFKALARTSFFRFLLVFLTSCFLLNHFFWTEEYYVTTSHLPLTSIMTYVRIIMMVMIYFIVILIAGELLFKDRKTGVWQITDAMPTPSWVYILSRFITVSGVGFLISTLMLATGVMTQFFSGFSEINWGLYIKDLYGPRMGWLMSVYLITMVFFIGSLLKNRLAGHVFSITIFLFFLISLDLGTLEQLRFSFPFTPGVTEYSEMNGYGIFDTALQWFAAAWTVLSVIFMICAVVFWNRGADRALSERIKIVVSRLNPVNVSALLVLVFCFGLIQYGIHDNLVVMGGYQTTDEEIKENADYERKYKKYAELNQPKILSVSMNLEMNPEQRKAAYTAELLCKNKGSDAVKTLHVDRKKFLKITNMTSAGNTIIPVEKDSVLRYAIYKLNKSLLPGQSMKIKVRGECSYEGFQQTDPQADIVYNGSFTGTDILPYFGYNEDREIENNKDRLEQGLPLKKSRMDDAGNSFSSKNSVHSDQADLFTWNVLLSTCSDQHAIAPGRLVKSWKEPGRNYYRYVSEKPGHFDLRFVSARYSKTEITCGDVPVTIFYHPTHTYNIEVYEDAAFRAIKWLGSKLGDYPYSDLKILEKPFYDDDFVTFANVIAVSEKHGWTADISKQEDKQYIYYTMAREIAKQWINSKVVPANVQGAEIFTRSVPEYFALLFMEEQFGMNEASRWFEQNYEDYVEGKGEEEISEKPVISSDEASYVSKDKGGRVLYAISRRMGFDEFNTWLKGWLQQKSRNDFVMSHDFYNGLHGVLPVHLRPFAEECFKKRVQYRISLEKVSLNENSLDLAINAASGIMDGLGNLTRRPFDSLLEIGLFDEKGRLVETRKVKVKSGSNNYTLNSSFSPKRVVLDPHYWYMMGERKRTVREIEN